MSLGVWGSETYLIQQICAFIVFFSFVKLSFGRLIVDVLNYIFCIGVAMLYSIVIHLYIWRVQWFCTALGHLKFIHIDDKVLLKWSSRRWRFSFYNIGYRYWINFGLILLLLKSIFLLIEISAFEWANFCIRFKISSTQILISKGRNLILHFEFIYFAYGCHNKGILILR
jgi:hypothetical protein